jgi:hypothetical protein
MTKKKEWREYFCSRHILVTRNYDFSSQTHLSVIHFALTLHFFVAVHIPKLSSLHLPFHDEQGTP